MSREQNTDPNKEFLDFARVRGIVGLPPNPYQIRVACECGDEK